MHLRNLHGTKPPEDRYSWTSPRRFATVIASVRLRTFSFVKMLRKCPLTVVSLLAGLFALCGAAALPVNPDAGSAVVGCQLGVAAMALQSALVQLALKGAPPLQR